MIQRSAGSRIAASLHQCLNINVWGQIRSHGNPFRASVLPGKVFWVNYANLCGLDLNGSGANTIGQS